MPVEELGGSDDESSLGRVVLLHGFTQTRRCWGAFGAELASHHTVAALDSPGHGHASDVSADLWRAAELAARAGGEATYIGYSMGARIALHVAIAGPEVVQRLVLISGTAGIDEQARRAERRAADEALAERIERIGVEQFLEEWFSQPLLADLAVAERDMAERLRNTAAGLARSLREVGAGTQEPLWSRLGDLKMPVLLVTGTNDFRYRELARRVGAAIGANARHIELNGGHTVHRQDPRAASLISRWIRSDVIKP